MGNVLALKRGTGEERMRVMLAAHMDEIGLMVVGYDDDGFLYSSEFDPCSEIRIYSAYSHPEASLEGKIPLDQTLHKVQGGCFYEGRLYLSCDDEGKSIYAVDSSGRVSKVLDTEIEWEMEDLYIDEEGEIYFIDHQGSLYKVSPGL